MNAKQRRAAHARFQSIMKAHGAHLEETSPYRLTYHLPCGGFTLACTIDPDTPDAVFCRWRTGDPALRAAVRGFPGEELEDDVEAREAYRAYRESCGRDAEAIKAAGLPYDNPHTLKWNHHGAGQEALDSLEQGLASHPLHKNQQKEA